MKRHPFDTISFICGLVATVIGLVFLIPAYPSDLFAIFGDLGQFLWPTLLLLLGVAVLVPVFTNLRGDADTGEDGADRLVDHG